MGLVEVALGAAAQLATCFLQRAGAAVERFAQFLLLPLADSVGAGRGRAACVRSSSLGEVLLRVPLPADGIGEAGDDLLPLLAGGSTQLIQVAGGVLACPRGLGAGRGGGALLGLPGCLLVTACLGGGVLAGILGGRVCGGAASAWAHGRSPLAPQLPRARRGPRRLGDATYR